MEAMFLSMISGLIYLLDLLVSAIVGTFRFLFANWIIQALFAAWVAFEIQQVSQSRGRRFASAQKKYEQSMEAIRRLFGILDARVRATEQYLSALEAQKNWDDQRDEYREAVKVWNVEATALVTQLLMLLPSYLSNSFDREIFPALAALDGRMRLLREDRERRRENIASLNACRRELGNIKETSAGYFREYLQMAERRRQYFEGSPPISYSNRDVLTTAQLVRSLFVR